MPGPTQNDTTAGRRARPTAGYTLVEIMIVVVILVVVSSIVTQITVSSNEAQRYRQLTDRATELGQVLVSQIREELESAVRAFDDDAVGTAYRSLLELPAAAAPLSSTELPAIDGSTVFDREARAGERTGNALLFARYAWTAVCPTRSGNTHRVDVVHIVHYYLTANRDPSDDGLGLARFTSEPLANAYQLDGVTDPTDRADVLMALARGAPDTDGRPREPVELLWRWYGEPSTPGTLQQIDPATGIASLDPLSPRPRAWAIRADDGLSLPDLLRNVPFVVARNDAHPSFEIGRFGLRDDAGDGFPHGFEVQVAGPSYARRVLVRLVLASAGRYRARAVSRTMAITTVRDA